MCKYQIHNGSCYVCRFRAEAHLKPLPCGLAVEDVIRTTEGLLFRFAHKGRKPQTAYRSGEEICASGALLALNSSSYPCQVLRSMDISEPNLYAQVRKFVQVPYPWLVASTTRVPRSMRSERAVSEPMCSGEEICAGAAPLICKLPVLPAMKGVSLKLKKQIYNLR